MAAGERISDKHALRRAQPKTQKSASKFLSCILLEIPHFSVRLAVGKKFGKGMAGGGEWSGKRNQ